MTAPIRGSDSFLSEDVLRMLRSIAAVHESTQRATGNARPTEYANGYSDGFMDGLRATAEAMGLPFNPGRGNVSIGVRWGE